MLDLGVPKKSLLSETLLCKLVKNKLFGDASKNSDISFVAEIYCEKGKCLVQ